MVATPCSRSWVDRRAPTAATLERLHQRVAEAGVINHVMFVAPQTTDCSPRGCARSDVTLVPSRAESFGLVALESSACGTPVVASDVGGLTSLIDDGVTGFLVGERDADDWADVVEQALDGEDAMSLSNAAVLLARRYTWRGRQRRWRSLIEQALSESLVRC